MNFEMQKALMFAENIDNFIQFVQKCLENKNNLYPNTDKIYQIKLWIEDFKFQIIADELLRINQHDWNPKYTHYLINQFQTGFTIIEEYEKNNHQELFILSGRLYTLRNLIQSFEA